MDGDKSSTHQPVPFKGGVSRACRPRRRGRRNGSRSTRTTQASSYELRDPFAEVTYRANAFPQMVAKAEQLGGSLFFAVTEDGERTNAPEG